jgi:pyrimidine-specific ribonucleoside hydrolase/non-specific riboncleoside hydrolase
MRKFVIDCDTGTDDAIAILAAAGCTGIEILGITSVNGNVMEHYVSQNNLNLCEYIGLEVPVCHGAVSPLYSEYHNSLDMTHGLTGLGTLVLPEAKHHSFDPRIASEFLNEMAEFCGGELELLVTGPMTNIALAIIQYPEFAKKIRHLYFMGGAVWGGNVTTTAEFNIWVDPEAARVVFQSGIPMTMVGLDVTLKAIMQEEDIEELRLRDTRESRIAADLLVYMQERYANGGEDVIMHDALAFAAAVYPECMKFENYWVDVETAGDYTRGHTYADLRSRSGNEPNMRCAMRIDVPAFRAWLLHMIKQSGN